MVNLADDLALGLKAISLRIVAIDKAIHGADFVEVFRFFIDSGQSPLDSFTSSQRDTGTS